MFQRSMSIYKHFSSKLRALVVFFVLHFLAVTGCMPSFRRHTLGFHSWIHMHRIYMPLSECKVKPGVSDLPSFIHCLWYYKRAIVWTRTSTINYSSITSFFVRECCWKLSAAYHSADFKMCLLHFISRWNSSIRHIKNHGQNLSLLFV